MTPETPLQALFWRITGWRWPILILSLALIGLSASFMLRIEKDVSADAFIDPQSPALLTRQAVEETFGLKDPIVAAVIAPEGGTVFTPEALALVDWLSARIERLPNVDPERVTSLATQTNIVGTVDGIVVEEFFEPDPDHFTAPNGTPERAAEIAAAIAEFPLYQGSLVSRDGRATVIVAELLDEFQSEATYEAVLALLDDAPVPAGYDVHIAGEGAVGGYLATYIDRDANRLNPIAGAVITTILLLAFMSIRAAVIPNLIVAGTVAGGFGLMGLFGVDFYVITNGLIVNLIGIAVADSIHVFSQFFEEQRARPEASRRELATRAMAAMARPITLTTVTTIAGFIALAASSVMPPIYYFGVFGAVGVAVAWFYSVTLLPALLAIWPGRLPRPFRGPQSGDGAANGVLARAGAAILARPRTTVGIAAVLVAVSGWGMAGIVADDARIENFKSSEPLYAADKAINATIDGTYYLDILIEADAPERLYEPAVLARMEALQDFLITLPGVNGATSIVDYVKQLHRAVNENDADAYRIPDDALLIAQLFFLYNASADPTDFQEEVDRRYQRALIRASVDTGAFSNNRVVIPAVERYLAETFDGDGVTGVVTGRVNVDYHWLKGVTESTALSVALSFGAVTLTAMLVFGSVAAGLLAVLPVLIAVLMVYAVMGYGGIPLGVGTSMFAAIAIGLGVDFAIHTLDRIRELTRAGGVTAAALLPLYPTTGRALLFNFLALALGFGVLITSDVPPLLKFGALVAVAVATAFVAALTVLPALALLLKPRFLTPDTDGPMTPNPALAGVAGLAFILAALSPTPGEASNVADMTGREIIAQVNARDDGAQVTRRLTFHKTDRGGVTIVESGLSFRKYFGDEKRTVLFYEEPTNIRGTGFLTFDYPDPSIDDDQWLYLPALRKVRRISASDRGGYFLGTDFTYEEIKKEQKVEITDYTFEAGGMETVDGVQSRVVEAVPVNDAIARELGYSRIVYRVDPAIWMSRLSDYYDLNGNHLKTIHLRRIEDIDGIWTATEIFTENHKTGHSTRLVSTDIDYATDVSDGVFSSNRLRRGL